MKITTNHHQRELFSWNELAVLPGNQTDDFDYIEGEDRWSARLFQYRGSWYDYHEFEHVSEVNVLSESGWHGQQIQSFWDAIVVRYIEGSDDMIVVGHATW